MDAEWSLSGSAANGYISVGANDVSSCIVKFHKAADMGESVNGTLTLTLKKKVDGSVVATNTFNITMAVLYYPTESNTTINGDTKPEGDSPIYTWESTATGEIGAILVEWSLDDELKPYYEIQSQEYDAENPLQGSVTLTKIMDVQDYMSGNINLTITRVSSGISFTVSKELSILNPNVIMTDNTNPAVLEVMYNNGLCANSTYMTKQEAEAVTDGSFNPSGTQTGSIFNDSSITTFNELKYFTGLTQLDAYTFYNANNLVELTIPSNIRTFKMYCCYVNSYVSRAINGDISVDSIGASAFDTLNTGISLNTVNFNCSTKASNGFNKAKIKVLNINAISRGSSSQNENTFCRAQIDKMVLSESISEIPNYAFYGGATISDLEIHDNITYIGDYAFNGTMVVSKMSSNIKTLGTQSLYRPTFKTDVYFNNLTFANKSCVYYATYEGKVDFSKNTNGGSTFYAEQIFEGLKSCNEFWIPERVLTYDVFPTSAQKANKVYISDFKNYCSSSFSTGTPATKASELYIKNINTGEFDKKSDINTGEWLIDSISSNAFYNCKAITGVLDVRTVKDFTRNVLWGTNAKILKIDNFNGAGTIGETAFAYSDLLEKIEDSSTEPWKQISIYAFKGVNADVTINSQVFGLYKQSSGFTISPMASDVVCALAFGDYTFTCPSGAAFGDGTTSKTITLGAGNKIQDLTDMLKIEYLTLVISSNMEGAKFRLTYTSSDGTEKEDVVSAGSRLLNVAKGTNVVITPETKPNGWDIPTTTTVTMSSESNSVTMDYTENAEIYIAHKNATLYTPEEWSASGYPNEDAEGVCVMRTFSGGFIISKEYASASELKYGGYSTMIEMVADERNATYAVLDMDGVGNTPKIIEQLAGTTDSNNVTGAPAAEACAAYTFPSGQTGYLPALGELKLAYDYKSLVSSAIVLIGGRFGYHDEFWSSTVSNWNDSWRLTWRDGSIAAIYRDAANYAWPFALYGYLNITANIVAKFTVSYTNNNNEQVTRKVGTGGTSLNVKVGTQVTVTPDLPYAEPQTFTWQGFTHECNFVFAKDAGVYIQHVNGSLHTESEWIDGGYANSDANGVAILGSDASCVIAKEDASATALTWGGYGKTISGIETTYQKAMALLDFDGIGNTPKIIEQCNGYTSNGITGAPAAEACANYTFPSGANGYLPALGEWELVYDNKDAVVSAMTLIGGTEIHNKSYCSSTQYSYTDYWYMYLKDGTHNYKSKTYTNAVRAFAAL